jgi:ClpA/ClpB-like protein
MFERYAENARRAIFFARDEASRVGSSCIEAEHLLLGVMRSCDPELNEALKLKDLEDALRAELAATGQQEIISKRIDIPLANQSKRILAYAAEEAERLNSREIGSAHLLLGIAREPESIAAHFLSAHNLDLLRARQMISLLSRSHLGVTGQTSRARIGWASGLRRRHWIGTAVLLALLILLGLSVATSTVAGSHLLVVGTIWFVAAIACQILAPSSFFWSFGKCNRVFAIALSYAFGCIYQLFMFGWLIPIGVGIYRVTR